MKIRRCWREGPRAMGVSLLLGLPGCAQNGLGDPTGSTCPADSTLTYQAYGQAFMEDHCVRCHDDFSTQEGVREALDRIDRSAAAGPDAVNTYMPEGEDLSDETRRKLGEWLACGAP
jgi:hypothetical protein